MARNPKDMVASYYHHNRLVRVIGYENDFKQYVDYFQRDLCKYHSPFIHKKT